MSARLLPSALAERLGLTFCDASLLERALTHPSWSLENGGDDYERLEFLGDSVVALAVSDHLHEAYPERAEGDLTRMRIALVRGDALADVASGLGLHEAARFGKGAEKSGDRQRPSVREALFEALAGALFIDGGYETARMFVLRSFAGRLDAESLLATVDDPKSALQEAAQRRGLGSPTYRIVSHTGPDHDRSFDAEVSVGGESAGSGSGRSKQAAEADAATHALEALEGGRRARP